MSWLRMHVRDWCVPAIKALIDAERRRGKDPKVTTGHNAYEGDMGESGSVRTTGFHPLSLSLRPAGFCSYSEAGYVAAALSSFGALTPERKSLLSQCDPELFKPTSMYEINNLPGRDGQIYKWFDVMHSIVKHSLDSLIGVAEATKASLILPGRDVWVWEVLARKKGVPTIYDPRVSRMLVRHPDCLKQVVDSWRLDLNRAVVFDTGFAGSIWRAIKEASGQHPQNIMLSTGITEKGESCQIFPKHKGARAKALAIEYLPKYQKTGTVKGCDDLGYSSWRGTVCPGKGRCTGQPAQWLSPLDEFLRATALTIRMWHHVSPAWIYTPVRRRREPFAFGAELPDYSMKMKKKYMEMWGHPFKAPT